MPEGLAHLVPFSASLLPFLVVREGGGRLYSRYYLGLPPVLPSFQESRSDRVGPQISRLAGIFASLFFGG